MNKFILSFTFAMACMTAIAQPPAFSYQAVVRDAGGVIIANQAVGFRISILQGSAVGAAIYTEDHSSMTNDFGLTNLEIGNGSPVLGTFGAINWGTDDYFIEIGLDLVGGGSYTFMGTSQLLSVPYALFAGKSGEANPNGPAGGDLSGSYPDPSVSSLQGQPISANAPAANQVLKWSGSLWAPVAENSHSHFNQNWSGSNASYGLIISNSGTGDGLRSFANTSNGNNWGAVYTINNGTSPGIFANTGSSGTYSGYFPKSIYVGGNCIGCTMVYTGQNNGTTPLQTGDLVAISSLAPPLVGTSMPLIQVEAVNAANASAAFGVVQSRGLIEVSEKEGEWLESINMASGVAEVGEFVFVVVQGMAQVRVQDGIKAGDLVVVGANGRIQPFAGDSSLFEIGRSLESANTETGLAWVLVGVR